MATTTKLDQHQGDVVDVTSYRGMIGSLMYLTASRPDIMYAIMFVCKISGSTKRTSSDSS